MHSHNRRPDEEVDLTNLIDLMVMLVSTLMILLPAYSMVKPNLPPVDAPKATAADLRHPRIIRLTREGQLFLDDRAVSITQLEEAMRAQTADKKKQPNFILEGDSHAPYGVSLQVLNLSKKLGTPIGALGKPVSAP